MRTISIGAVARATGVKVPTIRYYEEIGLLPEADRSDSNRRTYDDATIRRLSFVRHARDLGFSVGAIRQLLDLSDQPDHACSDVDLIARLHLADIDEKIARLTALRGEVKRMVDEGAHGRVADCRVIEVLCDHNGGPNVAH